MRVGSRQFVGMFQALCQRATRYNVSLPSKHMELRARRCLCTFVDMSEAEYEQRAESTLTCLVDFFDMLPDRVRCHPDYDVTYSMGVLTANISPDVGTYVINKQTPNRQIWFSSPISGPKRYDYEQSGRWVYKHDGVSLNAILEAELQQIFSSNDITVPS